VHLLVDAGGYGLAAAFGIELVDVRHEQLDLTPSTPPAALISSTAKLVPFKWSVSSATP